MNQQSKSRRNSIQTRAWQKNKKTTVIISWSTHKIQTRTKPKYNVVNIYSVKKKYFRSVFWLRIISRQTLFINIIKNQSTEANRCGKSWINSLTEKEKPFQNKLFRQVRKEPQDLLTYSRGRNWKRRSVIDSIRNSD